MSSWGDCVELKVTGFEKPEEGSRIKLPNLSYKEAFEEYHPQNDFSWFEWSIKNEERNSTTVFSKSYYTLIPALMNNLEKILVDGRKAPYERCFHGHYLSEQSIEAVSYKIEEIDNATGKVLFQQEIDTIPNIVHDVDSWEKENLKEAIIITDKNQMIELLDLNSSFYELASETLKEDEELALKAVEGDGWNYDSLIEKFKNSKKFQLAAVTENSALLHSLPKEVLNDYSFILEACKKNYHCLMYKELWGEEIQRRIEKDLGLDKVKKTYKDEELPF